MNKVAHYLQQHLVGEVLTSPDVLKYFATDESIFYIEPLLVAHPRSENDLRKTARFSWQLAERGRIVPITIKGKGTDRTGASLGRGIMLSMTAHMNKIIELDPKSGKVAVEAGSNLGKLQQTLHTHGRYLPSVSQSSEYTTIGGALGNNDSGPESYKYGPIKEFVSSTRSVLANGELVITGRLSKRELGKKLGLASFEGEIYRSMDKLIEESVDLIEQLANINERSNVGYPVHEVKLKDGSFDITPLIAGSQGTLALVSEITLDTEIYNPQRSMVVAKFTSSGKAFDAVMKINKQKQGPLSIDFLDQSVVEYVQKVNPNILTNTFGKETPETTLFIQFEEKSANFTKKHKKCMLKTLVSEGAEVIEVVSSEIVAWTAALESVGLFLSSSEGASKPVPIISEAVIPIDKLANFILEAKTVISRYTTKPYIIWGQAGSGIVQASPMFDISQIGDKQKMFKLLDEYYSLVVQFDGVTSGNTSEGRLLASQQHKVLTKELEDLMVNVKKIFDPFNTLNPGVKLAIDVEELKPLIRNEYSLGHQHSHLNRG